MDGYFTRFGLKDRALHACNVTYVIFLKVRVGIFPHAVPRHINLNIALQILHITKRRLTHNALAHHTAGNGNLPAFQRVEMIPDLKTVMRHIIFCDLKGVFPRLLQSRKLLSSHLQKLVDILLALYILLPLLLCHLLSFLPSVRFSVRPLNLQHFILNHACLRLHIHRIAYLAANQGLTHGRLVGNLSFQAVGLG